MRYEMHSVVRPGEGWVQEREDTLQGDCEIVGVVVGSWWGSG